MSGHIAISLPTASSYCSTNTTWSLKGLDAFMYFIGRWGFFPACFLVLDLFQRYFKSRFLLQSSESIMPTYTSSIWIWWQLSICRRSWEGYWHGVFTAIWRYRKCMKPHSLWTLTAGQQHITLQRHCVMAGKAQVELITLTMAPFHFGVWEKSSASEPAGNIAEPWNCAT